jgi:hypothetical protein
MWSTVHCDVNEHSVSTVLGGVLTYFSVKDIGTFTDECKMFCDNRQHLFNANLDVVSIF